MISLDIGGRSFVIDLWWQVREGGTAPRKVMLALAKDIARREKADGTKKEDFDGVVLRRHQFGLGSGAECFGQASLAAALRPAALSFLGLFCLRETSTESPGLWWVCAIRQGSICGDKVFSTFQDARTNYLQMLDLLGKCDLERTCETPAQSMEIIIPMLRPEAKVEALNPPPKNRKLQFLFASVAILLLVAWAGTSFLEQKRLRQEQAALQELKFRRQAEKERLQTHPEQYFPSPTKALLLENCLNEMMALPLVVQGWTLTESLCEPSSLTLTYRHEAGASFQTLPEHTSLVDKATAKAVLPRPTAMSRPITHFLSKDEAIRMLYQITQDAGIVLRHAWQPRESREVDGMTLYAPWTPALCEFTLPESLLEPQLATLLENIPGLNLTAVLAADQWVVKGVIHVR